VWRRFKNTRIGFRLWFWLIGRRRREALSNDYLRDLYSAWEAERH